MSAHVSENNTRITFTITKELKSKADEYAKSEKRSLSNLINVALEDYINKNHENGHD